MRPVWTSGPASLTLVRHAHSVANGAAARAEEAGAEELDLERPDAAVELSDLGMAQAAAVGTWLAAQESSARPTLVVSSPYLRALQTAERVVAGLGLDVLHDERLRERDPGVFMRLTELGIRTRFPEEVGRRTKVGPFYYQPPRGESWSDVALRVRSFLDDLRFGYDDARVWVFTHQAVVMAFRYVFESLSEERLVDLDRTERLPNASLTTFRRQGVLFELVRFAHTGAVDGVADTDGR
jgi:broad specificity phosphatase PhoE